MDRCALVLEGGAIRGVFTAGALDFLMEKGVTFPYVASVSAGTCCAMGFLSGQIGRTRACMMPDPDNKYFGLQTLRESGHLMDLREIFLSHPFDRFPFDFEKYFHNPAVHEIVATDRETAQAVYFQERTDEYRLGLAAMASCSIPLLNEPVELDGRFYYDGGIADSIPVGRALGRGYRKILVIMTRRQGHFPSASVLHTPAYRAFLSKHPAFLSAMESRPARYRAQVEMAQRLEEQGRCFLLRPTQPELSHLETNPTMAAAYYRHGYKVMESRWDEFQRFLEK